MEVGLSPCVPAWSGVCHQCSVPAGENPEHFNDDGNIWNGFDIDASYEGSPAICIFEYLDICSTTYLDICKLR